LRRPETISSACAFSKSQMRDAGGLGADRHEYEMRISEKEYGEPRRNHQPNGDSRSPVWPGWRR
jgi:hypothetical protein